MDADAVRAIFDRQAAGYDAQWARTAAIRDCLHLLVDSLFADLPEDANLLCVGVGTGAELVYLAERHPHWRFTAVEPSGPMLAACRGRAEQAGVAARCRFHEGYLDSLPALAPHDAATCFLVSQFLVDAAERTAFFRAIAARLVPGGVLASTDLAADRRGADYEVLLAAWVRMMAAAEVAPDAIERMRRAYDGDVAVLPPDEVAALLRAAGFAHATPFFQAGLIRGWFSRR